MLTDDQAVIRLNIAQEHGFNAALVYSVLERIDREEADNWHYVDKNRPGIEACLLEVTKHFRTICEGHYILYVQDFQSISAFVAPEKLVDELTNLHELGLISFRESFFKLISARSFENER